MNEIWKDIPEFEGIYQVSNMGRIKSLLRKSYSGRMLKERLLSPTPDTKGYVRVTLHKNKKAFHKSVHRIVAEVFIDGDISLQVNHIDGIKTNNVYTNLEWCTNKENSDHAYNTGLKNKEILNKAFKIRSIKLDTEQEQNHYSINQAAKDLNLYPSNILNVLKGKFKQSGGYMFEYL